MHIEVCYRQVKRLLVKLIKQDIYNRIEFKSIASKALARCSRVVNTREK